MKEIRVNAAALVEMLRRAIEKNPNSGTYMIVDANTGCLLLLSMSIDLNAKIQAWFTMQIQKGNAAGTITDPEYTNERDPGGV